MPFAIGTNQIKDGTWKSYAVCSGADMEFFYAETQDKAYSLAKNYLDENYFNLSNEEINKRVELIKEK